jgi:MFS family permease
MQRFEEEKPQVTLDDVRQLLRRSAFRSLVGTRIFGQIGDGMLQASLAGFILFAPEQQENTTAIAVAFALLLLPYSFFGPFIGILIDRWPRARILVVASLLRGASVIWVSSVFQSSAVWLGLTVLVTLGFGRFILATLSASLPHVVSGRELVTANAFAPTAGTMASAIGGMIGIGLQQVLSWEHDVLFTMFFAASCQVLAALTASRIPRDSLGPESVNRELGQQIKKIARELVSGYTHLRSRISALRYLLAVVVHRMAFGIATVQAIILIRQSLSTALADFTFVVGGAAVGAFIAAVITPAMVGKFSIRLWPTYVLSTSSIAAGLMLLGTITQVGSILSIILLIAGAFFLGFAGQTIKVCSDSVVQAEVSDTHRGRVFAIYDMAVNVGLVIGIVVSAFGIADDGRSVWPVIAIAALLAIAPLLLRLPPRK